MGVKILDFQKVTISTLFKRHNVGLVVLIPESYNMLGWGRTLQSGSKKGKITAS